MLFEHPKLPGRSLRLAYCLNLHGAEDLAGLLDGMRRITLPLRDRLAQAQPFGVGMYFPAALAQQLTSSAGAKDLATLVAFLAQENLDPFTFNAFPFGGFHRDGLKQSVFTPTWFEDERAAYTLAVAHLARALQTQPVGHVSISTHPGRFGPWQAGEFESATAHLARLLKSFAQIEADGGPRLRLALEAEPRAVAGDMRELGTLLERFDQALQPALPPELIRAHLGACLDTCHAAVEFEQPQEAVQSATPLPLGKLQVSSAIALTHPGQKPAAVRELLALDEPRYLHQTTGRRGQEFLRATDLPELRAACEDPASPWLACDEWRTHFHVPIDLHELPGSGLATTRPQALATLQHLLDHPSRWGSTELHVEIETYTWDILPTSAGGGTNLVDGLEREYGPVLDLLQAQGWSPARP